MVFTFTWELRRRPLRPSACSALAPSFLRRWEPAPPSNEKTERAALTDRVDPAWAPRERTTGWNEGLTITASGAQALKKALPKAKLFLSSFPSCQRRLRAESVLRLAWVRLVQLGWG